MKIYFLNIHRILFGFDVIIYFEIHIDDIQKYYKIIFYLMYTTSYRFSFFENINVEYIINSYILRQYTTHFNDQYELIMSIYIIFMNKNVFLKIFVFLEKKLNF